MGMGEELIGIGRVGAAEDDGGGGHGGGGFPGEVRTGVAGVDLVGLPRGGHVLRPLPAVMVRVPVSHLEKSPSIQLPTNPHKKIQKENPRMNRHFRVVYYSNNFLIVK